MTIDAQIEAALLKAQIAPEPGEDLDEIIQKGIEDEDKPAIGPMKITSAGYTVVYDTKTGVDSTINNNNLRAVLRKKRLDGTRVFGLEQTIVPTVGQYKCLLHQEDPNRGHYNDIGLAVCPKGNLASPYQVRRHMEKRHKTEWGAIEAERTDAEKKEDRDFQRTLMERAMGNPVEEKAPLYVSDKDK